MLGRKGKEMALTWDWDDKFAEATYRLDLDGEAHEYTVNCYEGNAWMIELWENKDEYTLRTFWCDEEHMMRCLGLRKGYDCAIKDILLKVRINKAKTAHFKKIVAALAQAFDNLTIEICTEL